MKKKLSVILLSLVMIATMMPLSVFADTANTNNKEITTEEANSDATAEETDSDATAEETESEEVDPSTDYLSFTAVDDDMAISMIKGGDAPNVTYEYSSDKSLWIDFTPGETTVDIAKDKTIYFRAKEEGQDFPCSEYGQSNFVMTGEGKINAGGNIMSLVSKNCSETKMQACGFDYLFNNCTPLATPPKLPATKLAEYCYGGMFDECSNLIDAPELPALEMKNQCYQLMFARCTSLTKAPKLPAETLAPDCYSNMFSNCSKLNSVSVGFKDWLVEGKEKDTTLNWLDGVATDGTFTCPEELDMSIRDGSHVPANWTVKHPDSPDYLSFTAGDLNMSISMDKGDFAPGLTYEYSSDKSSWTDFIPGTTRAFVMHNKTIYFRAKEERQDFPGRERLDECLSFVMEGYDKIYAGGNIMSLVSKDCSQTEMKDFGFHCLFKGCAPLATAPKLPATKLAENCYYEMFDNCESLVEAPELSATELAPYCYRDMFGGCSDLIVAPKLPAMELAEGCYNFMFLGCTNLTEPPELPATQLAKGCYADMFRECSNLAKAPELSVTTLAFACYSEMFEGCESLTKAPELPALKLEEHCYYGMFNGCTSLEKAPNLPAETLVCECYCSMFRGCSNLSSITVGFKDWFVDSKGKYATDMWVNSVPKEGTFTCPEELDTSIRDLSHVPLGWTIKHPAPPEPPVIPTMKSLKAKAIDSKTCQLNWEELTQFDNVKYEIYRGTSETRHWPKIDEVTGNSYIDTNVKAGTKYYYMLSPVVTIGDKEFYGPYSNIDYGYPRINALTGFKVWASDYETANISWNKCLDKDAEFWIYKGTKPTGDWGPVYAKVTENEATSWSETLTPGSKYYYMVREAVKGNDGKYYFGPYTKVDYAYPRLTAPSNFSAWASDKTTCKCSWTKLPGDGIQYLVYRGNAPTGNWGPAIGSTTDGSYTDKGRTTGHKYYYMVRAKVTVNGKTYFGPYTKVDYGYPR